MSSVQSSPVKPRMVDVYNFADLRHENRQLCVIWAPLWARNLNLVEEHGGCTKPCSDTASKI